MSIITNNIKPLTRLEQQADRAMRPLMAALGSFKRDALQETHPWHIHPVDPDLIDSELAVRLAGEKEALRAKYGPLFHMFGGWKHYAALEAKPPFHIGWSALGQTAINRLLIEDEAVRMLVGPENTETVFFAVKPTGDQLKLRTIGRGVLGDNQFPGTRLL